MNKFYILLNLLSYFRFGVLSFQLADFDLPICSTEGYILGVNRTNELYHELFDSKIVLDENEKKCILDSETKIGHVINMCVGQLTINNMSLSSKVSQGLAMNKENEWVSACAPDMPCIEFNSYVLNNSFTNLLADCGVENKFKKLLKSTNLVLYSYLGYEECQLYNPEKCIYLENNTPNTYYACPVSNWIFLANFILIYFLDPEIASRMPGCRISYYNLLI